MEDGSETFSVLSKMSFNSEEDSISYIIIHEITSEAMKSEDETTLANIVCRILSQAWNRCLREETVRSLYHFAHPVYSLSTHPISS